MKQDLSNFTTHFDVGGKKFANIFQAYDHSIKTKTFCYFKIDQIWIDQVNSIVLSHEPDVGSLKNLIIKKLKHLRKTHNYLVLSYSGGTDTHTILKTAMENKIYIDEIFTELPGLIPNPMTDEEQILGLNYCKKYLGTLIGKITTQRWNMKDYDFLDVHEWWKNPAINLSTQIRYRPSYAIKLKELYDKIDGVVITGHDKPYLRYKNNKFYWWNRDGDSAEWMRTPNCFCFFFDPEICVTYAYLLKKTIFQNKLKYFKKVEDRYDFLWHLDRSETDRVYSAMGYDWQNKIDQYKFTFKPHTTTHYNYKNQQALKDFKLLGHSEIIEKIQKSMDEVWNQYKHYPYMVERDKNHVVKIVDRYTQMFELTENKMICRGHDV